MPNWRSSIAERLALQYFAGHGVAVLATAATVLVAGAALGAEELGRWQLGATIGLYLALLANPGLDRYGIRTVAQKRTAGSLSESADAGMAVFRAQLVLLGVASGAGVLLFAGLLAADVSGISIAVALAAVGQLLRSYPLDWPFVATRSRRLAGVALALGPVLTLLLLLVLIPAVDSASWFAVVNILGGGATLVLVLPRVFGEFHSHPDVLSVRPRPLALGRIVRRSAPLGVDKALNQVAANVDFLFIAFLLGPVQLGVYAVAYRFVRVIQGVGAAAQGPLVEHFSRNPSSGTTRAALFLGLMAAVIAAPVFAIAAVALPMLGDEFSQGLTPLAILLSQLPLQFAGSAVGASLTARAKYRPLLAMSGLAAAANIAGNAILIPLHGLVGAAIATLGSAAVGLLLGIYAIRMVR